MAKTSKKKWLEELSRHIHEGVEEGHKLTKEMGESLAEGVSKLLPKRQPTPTGWDYKHVVAGTAPQLLAAIGPDTQDGWELVSVTHDGVNLIAFLKRPEEEKE